MSSQFIVIDSQQAMDDFLWQVDRFHDALLREVGIISRGYVTPGGGMLGDVAPSDARLVIHSQFPETPYIEIVCEELQSLRWEAGWDMDQAKGTVTNDGVELGFGPHPEDYMVSAKRMSYRILGREHLGKEPRTVQQIVESEYE